MTIHRLALPIPEDSDTEEAVLGALLCPWGDFAAILREVRAEHFYRPDHRALFAAICSVHDGGQQPDPILVADAVEGRPPRRRRK